MERVPMTATEPWHEQRPTALLVLADGTIVEGVGLGADGEATGEIPGQVIRMHR